MSSQTFELDHVLSWISPPANCFMVSANGPAPGPRWEPRSLLDSFLSLILHFPLTPPQVLWISSPKYLLNLHLPSSKAQSRLPSLPIWSPATAPPLDGPPAPTLASPPSSTSTCHFTWHPHRVCHVTVNAQCTQREWMTQWMKDWAQNCSLGEDRCENPR